MDPTPGQDEEGDRRVDFVYDYMGRRVRKVVEEHDGSGWVKELDRRFVCYNWLLVLELDGLSGNAIVRKYTWGLDLAGLAGQNPNREGGASLDEAGGISGLLATRDVGSSKSYIYLYDANGNVGQLVDLSDGSLDAKYEYDAYGNNLLDPANPTESGPYAADNPFRFSTKYWDDEIALGYWGHRYYSPRLGRWLNRDPIMERGGLNVYAYVHNRPVDLVDPLGTCCCKLGDKCVVKVEGAYTAARNIKPDEQALLLVFAATEFGSVFLPGPPGNPCAPEPRTGETVVAVGGLVSAMKENDKGAIWTRYQCKNCLRKKRTWRQWWAGVKKEELCTEWRDPE